MALDYIIKIEERSGLNRVCWWVYTLFGTLTIISDSPQFRKFVQKSMPPVYVKTTLGKHEKQQHKAGLQ